MKFSSLMLHLAAEVGLPADGAGARGVCTMVVDGMTISLSCLEDGNVIGIDAMAGVACTGQCARLEKLLAGNLIGQKTAGAVLSIDEHQHVNLSMRLQLEPLTFVNFKVTLERFIDKLEFWHMALLDFEEEENKTQGHEIFAFSQWA